MRFEALLEPLRRDDPEGKNLISETYLQPLNQSISDKFDKDIISNSKMALLRISRKHYHNKELVHALAPLIEKIIPAKDLISMRFDLLCRVKIKKNNKYDQEFLQTKHNEILKFNLIINSAKEVEKNIEKYGLDNTAIRYIDDIIKNIISAYTECKNTLEEICQENKKVGYEKHFGCTSVYYCGTGEYFLIPEKISRQLFGVPFSTRGQIQSSTNNYVQPYNNGELYFKSVKDESKQECFDIPEEQKLEGDTLKVKESRLADALSRAFYNSASDIHSQTTVAPTGLFIATNVRVLVEPPFQIDNQATMSAELIKIKQRREENPLYDIFSEEPELILALLDKKKWRIKLKNADPVKTLVSLGCGKFTLDHILYVNQLIFIFESVIEKEELIINELIELLYPAEGSDDKERAEKWFENLKNKYPSLTKVINEYCKKCGFYEQEINASIEFLLTLKKLPIQFFHQSGNDIDDILLKDIVRQQLFHCKNFFKFTNSYNLAKFVSLDLIHLLCGDTKGDNIAVYYNPSAVRNENAYCGNRQIDYISSHNPTANLVCIDAAEIYASQILCEHIGEKGHKIGHKQVLFWLLFNSDTIIDNEFCQYITSTSIVKLMLPMINALQNAHQQHDIGIKSIGKLGRNVMDVVLHLYRDELSIFAKKIEHFVEFIKQNKGIVSYRKIIKFLLDPIVYYAMEKQIAKFNGNAFGAFINTSYVSTNLDTEIFDRNDLSKKQDWLKTGEEITLEQALNTYTCKATDLVNARQYSLQGEIIGFFTDYVNYNNLTYEDFVEATEVMIKHVGWDSDLKSNKKYTATKLKWLYKAIEEYDTPKILVFLEIMDNLKYAYDGKNIIEKILGQFEGNLLKLLQPISQDYSQISKELDSCLEMLSLVLSKFPDLLITFTIGQKNTYAADNSSGFALKQDIVCSLTRVVVEQCRYSSIYDRDASSKVATYCEKLLQLCVDNGVELCNSEYIAEFKKIFTPLQMELEQFFDAYSRSQPMPQFGSIILLLNSGVDLGFDYLDFLKRIDDIKGTELNRLAQLEKIFPKQILYALFLKYEGFRREVLLFPNGWKDNRYNSEQLFLDNGYQLIAKSLDSFSNHKLWANQFLAMSLIETFFSLIRNQSDSQLSLIPLSQKSFFALEHFDHFDSPEIYRLDTVLEWLAQGGETEKNKATTILKNLDSWQFTQLYLGSLLTHMIISPDNITLVKIGNKYHLKVNDIIQCFEPHIDDSTGAQRLAFVNIILLISKYVEPAKIPTKLIHTEKEIGQKLLNWYDRMDALDKETGLFADGKLYNTIFLEKIYNRLLEIFSYIHQNKNFTFDGILKETKYFAYLLYELVKEKGLHPLQSYAYLEKNEYLKDELWIRAHSGTTKENTRVSSIHSLDENQVTDSRVNSREILKSIVDIEYETFLNNCNDGNVKILDQYNIKLFLHRLAKDPKLSLSKMDKNTIKKYMEIYIAFKALREFRLYFSDNVTMKNLENVLIANRELKTLSIEKCSKLTDLKTILDNSSLLTLRLKNLEDIGLEIKGSLNSEPQIKGQFSSNVKSFFKKRTPIIKNNVDDLVGKSLKTLIIDNCTIIRGALDLRFIPSLSRLEIKDCNNLSILTLHQDVPLQNLELINCQNLNGEAIFAFLNKPKVLSKIEVLKIENCPAINASYLVAELVDLGQINPSAQISFKLPGGELRLQDLEFSGRKIQITDNHLNALTKNHFHKPLAKLTLQDCENVTLEGISTIIKNFENLLEIRVKTSNGSFILNLDSLKKASKIDIHSIGSELCISVGENQMKLFQFLVPLVKFCGLGKSVIPKGNMFVIYNCQSQASNKLLGFLGDIGVKAEFKRRSALPISSSQKDVGNSNSTSSDSSGPRVSQLPFVLLKPAPKPPDNSPAFNPEICKNK